MRGAHKSNRMLYSDALHMSKFSLHFDVLIETVEIKDGHALGKKNNVEFSSPD